MPPVTNRRRRSTKGPRSRGTYTQFLSGVPTATLQVYDMGGTQYTESEGHAWPPPKGGGLSDVGGPFYTTRSYVEGHVTMPIILDEQQTPTRRRVYNGTVVTPHPGAGGTPQFPAASPSSDAQLDKFGATAIARCEPTNSASNVVTFLGELYHDGLPALVGSSVWKDRTRTARKAGSEYLNIQFGWNPLISDIQKFANAVKHADTVLSQYERDSGKVVRRRYKLPTSRSSSESVFTTGKYPSGFPSNNFNSLGTPSSVVAVTETTVDRWFSGAFTYYIPSDYDSRKKLGRFASLADKLLGTSPSPDDIWNLTPWSWAVDWFSNTGDVIHNLSKFGSGGLVMPYGYVMEHSVTKVTYRYTGKSGLPDPYSVCPPITLVTESKKRRVANPFGFGVSWNGLSSFQTSILAALGLSRSRR